MANSHDGQPNILLVITDQQHGDMMGCAGNPYLETPAMDALAETGVRFDRSYCTNPVCSPSRTSIMTGRFPSEVGLASNDDSHLESIPAPITSTGLGHVLREAGYDTAYAGKQSLPADMTPAALGFETLTTDDREGCVTTCAEFIERDRREPFFLVSSFINPHDICYMAIRDAMRAIEDFDHPLDERAVAALDRALERPEHVDREEFFADRAPPLPSNHDPQVDEPEAVDHLLDRRPFRRYVREAWSDERWREHRWAYCRLTEMVDAQIGRLLDAMEERGIRENTVVIFTSDHGDMDGSHQLEHKTVLYEEAVRVPFIVSHPDVAGAGTVDDRLVSVGLDLLPTVCDYAGRDPPNHCAGRSVRPLVEGAFDGPTDGWRSHVSIESELGDAIVTDRYKYVRYDRGDHREQLYDLQADPGETRNRLADPATAGTVAELRDRLSSR